MHPAKQFRAIARDEVLDKSEFLVRTGLAQHAWRQARKAGLKVREVHGKCFVLGQDWFDYLLATAPAMPTDAAATG